MDNTQAQRDAETCKELKSLLAKFNRGIASVEIEYGFIVICVSGDLSAFGVKLDLLRTRAFRTVDVGVNHRDGGFMVTALPKPKGQQP